MEEIGSSSSPSSNDDWRDVLAKAAEETFNESGHGLLLSRIPYVLRQNGVDINHILAGRRLATFLATESENKFTIIQNETNKVLLAILPASVNPEAPHSKYFAAPKDKSTDNRLPRYHPVVWRCFVKELPPGLRRWLHLAPLISFRDLAENETDPNGIEVERDFVRSDSLFKNNDDVSSNIQLWASKHNVDSSYITLAEARRNTHPSSGDNRNVMLAFLNSLSEEEARRIDIPADIVARFAGLRLRDC